MRLTAGLVTSERHDILLIDEGIGTDDANLQEKFRRCLVEFFRSAEFLVLASRSKKLLRLCCTHDLVLNQGSTEFDGSIGEAIDRRFRPVETQRTAGSGSR